MTNVNMHTYMYIYEIILGKKIPFLFKSVSGKIKKVHGNKFIKILIILIRTSLRAKTIMITSVIHI